MFYEGNYPDIPSDGTEPDKSSLLLTGATSYLVEALACHPAIISPSYVIFHRLSRVGSVRRGLKFIALGSPGFARW
ncbi:hypothetical protein I7I50_00418 [Histoplasma capsulatum G186AR]|uniref:Uncharacterized protein n=1 Tax=Ajellomyces capsulatus TaxID=5037 RepID=A0A8H7YIJ6_AJECA|nr:hypothetical protein I7I52_07686 [Histoplasma capsulatum]QSS72546.1 hypothetical protein I7I50_00418 [Histoplasma capsulatum G186AR]